MEILGEIYSFSFNFLEILKKNLIILQSQACDTLQLRKTKLSQHIPFQASESEDFDLLPWKFLVCVSLWFWCSRLLGSSTHWARAEQRGHPQRVTASPLASHYVTFW